MPQVMKPKTKNMKCPECGNAFSIPRAYPNKKKCPVDGCTGIATPIKEEEESKEDVKVELTENLLSFKVEEADYDRGIIKPQLDKNFYVSRENEDLLKIVDTMSKSITQNVMLVGPQGCGKTELPIWYAAKTGRPAIIIDCATMREAQQWFGYKTAKSGTLAWHTSDFVRALTAGGHVILLDEFNRIHTTVQNTLYALLDARRATWVEEVDEMIKVGPNTTFFATCNVGLTHHGTFVLDSAMEDRWGIRIDLDFLPEKKEISVIKKKTGVSNEIATKLCKLGRDIRRKAAADIGTGQGVNRAISTRQLLQTAQLMRHMDDIGMDPVKALEYTILPFYEKEGDAKSAQAQVMQTIQGIFGGKKKSA